MPSSRLMNRPLCVLAVISLLLAACGPATPTETPRPTETTTLVTAPIATPMLSETPATLPATETPTEPPTPVAPAVIKPLAVAPAKSGLRVDSWSPDSQWIAYWVGEAEGLPATLEFVNVHSGRKCQPVEVSAQDLGSGWVTWQEDDRVIAVLNQQGEALGGVVCETFAPVENGAPPGQVSAVDISPNARYRAVTRVLKSEGQAMYKTLTMTDLGTGKTIATVSYVGSSLSRWAGRGWLNDEWYLIGQTVDQGALLYVALPEGRTGNLFPGLFGLDPREEEDVWLVDRQADPATGEYHLLLQQWKESPGSPLLLYHGELDRVEKVPFYLAWPFFDSSSFTPDGEWLLLGNPIAEGEPGASINYWLRPVDPPGSAAIEIAPGVEFGGLRGQAQRMAKVVAEAVLYGWAFCGLSDQAQEMAFCRGNLVRIFGFPDGGLLGQWSTLSYDVRYLWWSPDGNRSVATGFDMQTGTEALFVIKVPDGSTPTLPDLILQPDGLGVADFGDEAGAVIAMLQGILGPLDFDSGWQDPSLPSSEPLWPGCPGTTARLLSWDECGLSIVLTDWAQNDLQSPGDARASTGSPYFAGYGAGAAKLPQLRTAEGAYPGMTLAELQGLYGDRLFVSPGPDEAVGLRWFAIDATGSPLTKAGGIRGWLFEPDINSPDYQPGLEPGEAVETRGFIVGLSCSTP